MTTQSTLGPFMTLILMLTAPPKHAATVSNLSASGLANSFLLAQVVIEILREKSTGHVSPSARVFRIGSSQECRVGS